MVYEHTNRLQLILWESTTMSSINLEKLGDLILILVLGVDVKD